MVLRHKPEKANIVLDPQGWTDVEKLLTNIKMDMPTLEQIVDECDKKRYEFNNDKTKIRARQGHSVEVDLDYEAKEPPEFLYHGTATRFMDAINRDGLKPMGRHHVHLSADIDTASSVGKRHGKLVVLKVYAKEMYDVHNCKFYVTGNGVWLTEYVHPVVFEILK